MIDRLHINQVRNIMHAELQTKAVNVFLGDNGSGKTSLLEAIFLLSRGRSFRHHEPKRYISHSKPNCTVWARLDDGISTLAIQKSQDATTQIKHNQINLSAQSELTRLMPTIVIDPSGMATLEEGSSARRSLLDWLVFHVKPAFLPTWQNYNRLLKQRNLLIKTKPHAQAEIIAWDVMLCEYALRLHELRAQVFVMWQADFDHVLAELLPTHKQALTLSYQAGFDVSVPLLQTLQARIEQDISLGYTRVGAHRADLMIGYKTNGIKELAINVLSRGEKKLLITALKLSQLITLCRLVPDVSPVVLIDDIDAELDGVAVESLLGALFALPCQLFITSLKDDVLDAITAIGKTPVTKVAKNTQSFPRLTDKTVRVFHVKQGTIEPK